MNAPLSSERPVGPGENFALLVGATVTTALFYVYVMAGMLALLAILLVECGLLLAALRIPMLGRLVLPLLQRHGGLLAVFFRSLWPQKGMEMRVPMEEGDSPRLFAMLKRVCEKAEVPMPREVVLEMGVNAWVNMKGWRAGTGKTTLGIGYDLIAGLTEGEVEGVLGHEMMHAKLVQRGFRQLITCGVGHSVRLARGLAGYAAPLRKGKREDVMVEGLLRVADVLARRATRQMAACSRQDEFAADRGAAELCGAGALRSSLMKIGGLQRIAARLPLRERVAHLESTEGFGLWLAKELAAADHGAVMEPEEVFNEYSTHPSPHDRLAALAGYPDEEEMSEAPAIEMLTRPDEIAEKLVGVIQKELVANEERDNKALGRWGRRIGASRKMQFLDLLGWGVLLTAAFCCIVGTLTGNATEIIVSTLAVGGGGMMIWGRPYREKMPMPMPGYAEIRAAGERRLGIDAEMVKRMEEEMRAGEAKKRTAREKAEGHLAESREALSQCDYVRAHVAARLCLQQMRKSIPGHLALAVAAAGIKNAEQARMAVLYVNRMTGLRGASQMWGAGWAMALAGDDVAAEAFLKRALKETPGAVTMMALLAICQSRRGKIFSAIESAREAHELEPLSKDYTKLLIELLLAGGFLREAEDRLKLLEEDAKEDVELMFAMVKLNLSRGNVAIAEEWMDRILANAPGGDKFVRLGQVCHAARLDGKGAAFYEAALGKGYYPEALLGLAQLAAIRRDREEAVKHLTKALNLERKPAEDSSGAIPLVPEVLGQLVSLQEPIANCQAWIATMPKTGVAKALAGVSFLVYAESVDEARKDLEWKLAAMTPGAPVVTAAWKLARREQQPGGPVHPGVQGVV